MDPCNESSYALPLLLFLPFRLFDVGRVPLPMTRKTSTTHFHTLTTLFSRSRTFCHGIVRRGSAEKEEEEAFCGLSPGLSYDNQVAILDHILPSDTFVLARLRFLAELEQKSDFFALCLCSTGLLFGFLNERFTCFSQLEKRLDSKI